MALALPLPSPPGSEAVAQGVEDCVRETLTEELCPALALPAAEALPAGGVGLSVPGQGVGVLALLAEGGGVEEGGEEGVGSGERVPRAALAVGKGVVGRGLLVTQTVGLGEEEVDKLGLPLAALLPVTLALALEQTVGLKVAAPVAVAKLLCEGLGLAEAVS